jgi:hypothetical protein
MVETVVACAQPVNDDVFGPGEQVDWVAFVEVWMLLQPLVLLFGLYNSHGLIEGG